MLNQQVSTNVKQPTGPLKLHHIEYIDVDGDGVKEEIAIVKRSTDGTIHYINIAPLDPIDKARLKRIVTSQHADKYPLWELLAQTKLENGMNALDFFHSNLIKVKRGTGTTSTQFGGGLATAPQINQNMPGSEFTNPAEAILSTAA
jgi:hypothetical protein